MARKTGLTKNTVERMVLDAGVVYFNYGKPEQKVLGAVRGGSTFTIESEIRDMPFDGVTGIVKGARRFLGTTATLSVNLVEINKELLKVALPGADYDALGTPATGEDMQPITDETYYIIKREITKTIPELDYGSVSIVAEYSGTAAPIVITLDNAIADGNLSLAFNDADESVLNITFTAALDPSNLNKEAWSIWMPEKDNV